MKDILPVVVFAFNRPEKLRRVLAAVRQQNIDCLVIFTDGPRGQNDRAGVDACRQLANSVDWVKTELHVSDVNNGSRNLHLHIEKVFEQYPAAIFLEDDCLPMPGFYSFMRQALECYRSETKVFSIGGYQPIAPNFFKDYPYMLIGSARFIGWGWATWRDRWQEIAPYLDRFSELFNGLEDIPEVAGLDVQLVVRAIRDGHMVNDWDYRVLIASLWLKKVHLLPVRGLIRNIGLDRSGVHGSFRGIFRDCIVHNWNVEKEIPPNLVWLKNVEINKKYMHQLQIFVSESRKISIRLIITRGIDIIKGI
jgi:hypothetical protein